MFRILLLIFLFNFINQANANISTTAQKKLISNKIIYEGLACNELISLLGGLNKIDLLLIRFNLTRYQFHNSIMFN